MADGATVSPTVKLGILILMSLTTTVYLLLVRWTRVVSTEKYFTTTTVAMQELVKFFLASGVLIFQSRGVHQAVSTIKLEAIDKPIDTLRMSVPSFVYALQNNMNFIALSNLEVPVQQILYQLKIPATAFCSVLLLKRSLSYQQWTACFMVFVGLAMIEYHPDASSNTDTSKDQNHLIGVAAVLVAVFCSAFAGVYFEKMVKGSETSLWVRNLQMYIWTTGASLIAVFTKDFQEVQEKGFFYGYSPMVWLLIVVAGINGLIVSLVLKYADNIVKGFAASGSIILSTVASIFLFQYNIGIGFIVGGLVVCSAICLYGIPLPCLGPKFTTVTTSRKMNGSGYDKLRSVTFNLENDEVNSK